MAIKGSPVVKDVYLDDQGNEMLSEDLGAGSSSGSYLDDQGNEIPAPQVRIPSSLINPLLARHQQNLQAQPQPQKLIFDKQGGKRVADIAPSQIELGMEVLKAPFRLAEGIGSLAKTVYNIGTRPADPQSARRLASLPLEAAEGIVDTGRKALGIYATPKEQAGALGDIATGILLPEVPGLAKGVSEGVSKFTKRVPVERVSSGSNQIIAAIHPANMRTMKSIDATIPHMDKYLGGNWRSNIRDVRGFSQKATETADNFYQTNAVPINKMLKDVPVEHNGTTMSFEQLLARRGEVNKILGRLGYYDKHPITQSLAKSSPQVQSLVEEAETIRGTLDKTMDTMAPTNVGAAEMLRTFADLKQTSDVTRIRADRIELAKRIKAGEAATIHDYARDFKTTLISFGFKQPLTARLAKVAIDALKKEKIDPDILIRRGVRNLERGRKAISPPVEIKPVPIKLPGAQSANRVTPEGQVELPFVESEVGGIPQRTGGFEDNPAQNIVLPNELTNQFNEPLGPAKPAVTASEAEASRKALIQKMGKEGASPEEIEEALRVLPTAGQVRLPFVEPEVGGVPQRAQPSLFDEPRPVRIPSTPTPPSKPRVRVRAVPVEAQPIQIPYTGAERRLAGRAQSYEANLTHNALRQAKANPEIANRAASLKDALDEAERSGNVSAQPKLLDQLTELAAQYPWVSDYLPTRSIVKGGPRQ